MTNVPVPDPSLLTTEQLDREILHLSTLLGDCITAERTLTNEQFKSRDLAIDAALKSAEAAVLKEAEVAKTQINSLQSQANELKTANTALQLQVNGILATTGGSAQTKNNMREFVVVAVAIAAVVVALILGFND